MYCNEWYVCARVTYTCVHVCHVFIFAFHLAVNNSRTPNHLYIPTTDYVELEPKQFVAGFERLSTIRVVSQRHSIFDLAVIFMVLY